MAVTQHYGIKYPFTLNNNDGHYTDLNGSRMEDVQSQVLHVMFTPKGQRLRNPDFGTGLIGFIFSPKDGDTLSAIKNEITGQVRKYVPSVEFRDINIYASEESDNEVIVIAEYGVRKGNKTEVTTVAVKI